MERAYRLAIAAGCLFLLAAAAISYVSGVYTHEGLVSTLTCKLYVSAETCQVSSNIMRLGDLVALLAGLSIASFSISMWLPSKAAHSEPS